MIKSDFGVTSKKDFWFVWAWIKLLALSVFQVQLDAEVLQLVFEKADSGVNGAGCQVKLVSLGN